MNEAGDIQISARKSAILLLFIAAGLAIAHIISVTIWYQDWLPIDDWLYLSFFDLDEEESLGTWFSALILFIAGQLSLLHARYARHNPKGFYAWWLALGIGFHLLSLDEIAGFHETLNTVVEGTHWTTFGLAIVVVIAVAYLPFLRALPARISWKLVFSGIVYVGGAVGVEWATLVYEDNNQLDTLAYNLWNALEEFMEMSGIILFIYTLLKHLATRGPVTSRIKCY